MTTPANPPRLFSIPGFKFALGEIASAIGKWSRFATMGTKVKDGANMTFDAQSLGQMVDNAARRGDKIAICADHASAFPETREAPSLGFFYALALVEGGKVVKHWALDDAAPPEASGMDDGLYGRLGEITPRGASVDHGLANFSSLSPMFSESAADEAGNSIGFAIYDIAATSVPFQSGCAIQFHGHPAHVPAPLPDLAVAMRIEQRGGKWVVLPETGGKVLGEHATKEEAEAQLRAIEASKHGMSRAPHAFSLPGWPGAVVCASCNQWMEPHADGVLPPHGFNGAPCEGSCSKKYSRRYARAEAPPAETQAADGAAAMTVAPGALHTPGPVKGKAKEMNANGAGVVTMAQPVPCPLCKGSGMEKTDGGRGIACRGCGGEKQVTQEKAARIKDSFKLSAPTSQAHAMARCPGCAAPHPVVGTVMSRHTNARTGVVCAGTGAAVKMATSVDELRRPGETDAQVIARYQQEHAARVDADRKARDLATRIREHANSKDGIVPEHLRSQYAEQARKANWPADWWRNAWPPAYIPAMYSAMSTLSRCPGCNARAPVTMSRIAPHENPRTRVKCAGTGARTK